MLQLPGRGSWTRTAAAATAAALTGGGGGISWVGGGGAHDAAILAFLQVAMGERSKSARMNRCMIDISTVI